ncbi:MAG: tRNA (adenosine(37)-N6)-threonylcarbamoyltransferase complex dimerization subunit type 1 TsaB [Thermoguttaceae bacterium]|nr:tRNA (adenosine(37)-N6)-threonylcarbamoyltransferase complex dimerization subunit type 1 TsaB [Thermoguttaceae bacterium]
MNELTRMLALETTDLTGSVALCERGNVLAVRFLNPDQRSAQSLAPAIQSILREFSWKPSDVDVVATTVGPGSFTGLRVGVAAAKLFSWSVGARIVGVDTLDAVVDGVRREAAISDGVPTSGFFVSAGVDAQRGDVAFRNYWVVPSGDPNVANTFFLNERFKILPYRKWLDAEQPIIADDFDDESFPTSTFSKAQRNVWEAAKRQLRKTIFYAGPALSRVKNRETLYPNLHFADPSTWNASAADVARVAWTRVLRESFDNPFSILPIYSRKAAAEEKALEKAAAKDALKQ